MAVGDIYVVKQKASYLAQQILNVYYFEQTTEVGDTDAFALWEAFDNDILTNLVPLVSDNYFVTSVEVFQIAEPEDFFEQAPTTNQGLRVIAVNDLMPSYVAFRYRSNRAGAGSRRSYKRFAGIGDADVNANGLSGTFLGLPNISLLADALGSAISAGAQSVYTPIQVKSGWVLGFAPIKNFVITNFELPVLTSQVSRRQ